MFSGVVQRGPLGDMLHNMRHALQLLQRQWKGASSSTLNSKTLLKFSYFSVLSAISDIQLIQLGDTSIIKPTGNHFELTSLSQSVTFFFFFVNGPTPSGKFAHQHHQSTHLRVSLTITPLQDSCFEF
jgi:hypothetical protein